MPGGSNLLLVLFSIAVIYYHKGRTPLGVHFNGIIDELCFTLLLILHNVKSYIVESCYF